MRPTDKRSWWVLLCVAVVSAVSHDSPLFLPAASATSLNYPNDAPTVVVAPLPFDADAAHGDVELIDGGNNNLGAASDVFKADGGGQAEDDENDSDDDNGRWSGLDVLVAVFFCVAALWLIAASAYSVVLVVMLRLQARGELDIYDEHLGRLVLCNGLCTLRFGWIVRRYAIQLEHDYRRRRQRQQQQQQQQQHQAGGEVGPSGEPERVQVRIMTKQERREAIEELLGVGRKSTQPCRAAGERPCRGGDGPKPCACVCVDDATNDPEASETSVAEDDDDDGKEGIVVATNGAERHLDLSFASSEEGPVCSICLAEYEADDSVFQSKTCPHQFHRDCLMGWLERRNNTECPCCRQPMVSDDEVWAAVRRLRKDRRKRLRAENGWTHRFLQYLLAGRRGREDETRQNNGTDGNSEADRVPSSTDHDDDDDPESQRDTEELVDVVSPGIVVESVDDSASGNVEAVDEAQQRDVDISTSPSHAHKDDGSEDVEHAPCG